MVEGILQACVVEQKLQAFYPPGSLGQIAQRVAQSGAVETIASNWKVDKELAMDTIRLALFDVVLLVDDSGSMAFEVRILLLRARKWSRWTLTVHSFPSTGGRRANR
jgi:hypothetical protein